MMQNNEIIIVLGSPNTERGELMSVALERCAQAVQVYQAHPDARLLLTGGFGDHFNITDLPHAFYLKQHLMSLGVPEDAFLPFALSRSTVEDVTRSYPIAQAHGARHVIVVTSDFHEPRARYLFDQVYRDIELEFSICATDEANCDIDLASQKAHEKAVLERLQAEGL
ncbi:MAG: YdcF family protein [Anaerolineae bacterium]|nr:YdcF family protein [Anaerolineae bacterium]